MDSKIKLREKLILGALAMLLAGGGFWRAIEHAGQEPVILQAGITSESNPAGGNEEAGLNEPDLITVHLVGAVNNPGIYTLPEGSRVHELIKLSGGASAEADQAAVNQARPLMDGEQVFIPLLDESAPFQGEGSPGSGLININRASAAELTALPGIGDVRAAQIVAHREANGPFRDPRDIMDVSGIGEATYNNISGLVTIY